MTTTTTETMMLLHNHTRAAAAVAAVVLLPGLAVGLTPSSAQAGVDIYCDGQLATIVGTPGNDRLAGTDGPDVIAALEGDDVVRAQRGADTVCGGPGGDRLYGDAGDDLMGAGAGKDGLWGSGGDDLLYGGHEADSVLGGAGADTLRGGTEADGLDGGADGDLLVGGDGDDFVGYSTHPNGVVVDLRAGGATDGSRFDGPRGKRDTLRRVENVEGTRFADELYGDEQANFMVASPGVDLVVTRRGDDTLSIQDGEVDTGNCGAGADTVFFDGSPSDELRRCETKVNTGS